MAVATYDPLMGFKFQVDVPGFGEMAFQKVSGLSLDVGILEVTEISNPITVTKLPDRISFSDLTLERGATPSSNYAMLWEWYLAVVDALNYGLVPKKDFRAQVNIRTAPKGILLDSKDPSIRKWEVYNAFPKTVKFGDFDATSSAVLIESLTLANEGYRLI